MKFTEIFFISLLTLPLLNTQAAGGAECKEKEDTHCASVSKQSAQTLHQEQRIIYSSGSIIPLMQLDEGRKTTQPTKLSPILTRKRTAKPSVLGADSLVPPNLEKVYSALDPQGRSDLKKCLALLTDAQILSHLPTFSRNKLSIAVGKKLGGWLPGKAAKAKQTLCQNYFKTIF